MYAIVEPGPDAIGALGGAVVCEALLSLVRSMRAPTAAASCGGVADGLRAPSRYKRQLRYYLA